MVAVKIGDLFSSDAQTLVNTVNCVGVMGKGVALAFKERFPAMFKDYVRLCQMGRVRLGEPYLYKELAGPWVLNFPTKDHWRSVSRLSDIVVGLEFLKAHYREWGITSLAVPPLGCGQGGLEWQVVGPTLYRNLQELEIPVEIYAPRGTDPAQLTPEYLTGDEPVPTDGAVTRIQPAWIALVEILERVVSEEFHWPVGRVTFQKLAYFATECGLPTGLSFKKGSFGPFSSDVKPLLTKLVNHDLIREVYLGRMFAIYPGPTFEDARTVFRRDIRQWDSILDEVADLFLRMRTEQAEVAATVLFTAKTLKADEGGLTEFDVFNAVFDWKQRRRPPLQPEEVARTIRSLNILRWVNLRFSEELPVPAEV